MLKLSFISKNTRETDNTLEKSTKILYDAYIGSPGASLSCLRGYKSNMAPGTVKRAIEILCQEFKNEIDKMKHEIQYEVDTMKEKAETNMKEMKGGLEELNKKIVALEVQLNAEIEKKKTSSSNSTLPEKTYVSTI